MPSFGEKNFYDRIAYARRYRRRLRLTLFRILEHNLRSVTANMRRDGQELLKLAADIPLHTQTQVFPLEQANEALQALKHDQINGAAVLNISAG